MTVLYIFGLLLVIQGIVSLLDGIRSARHIRTFRPSSSEHPRVAVFCPCRGVDADFRKNIASIREQRYPEFDAIFIVDSIDDAAYPELREMGVPILVAGRAADCGQKIHNLLYAIDHAPSAADVFVFCDSDARYPGDWLQNLIVPLKDDAVAVSTGYRWYSVERFNLPTLLRSVWNASIVTLLGPHQRNFAWGGSMAIRRKVFDEIGVRDFWTGSISDDYGVTRAARAAGRPVVFVPTCLIPSYGDCTWRELLEFTTRQILITRIYDAGMWRKALIAQSLYTLTFVALFVLMWDRLPAALLWVALATLSAAKAAVRLKAVASVLPERALSKYRWSYILLAPFIALLYSYNFVGSALTRQIVWRQIHYNLLSPNRVIVRHGGEKSSTR